MTWCGECEASHEAGSHYPAWEIWSQDEDRDEATVLRAPYLNDAVERWAEARDEEGDYRIVGGSPVTVHGARHGNPIIAATMIVTGEMVAEYTTRLVSNEDEAGP